MILVSIKLHIFANIVTYAYEGALILEYGLGKITYNVMENH